MVVSVEKKKWRFFRGGALLVILYGRLNVDLPQGITSRVGALLGGGGVPTVSHVVCVHVVNLRELQIQNFKKINFKK